MRGGLITGARLVLGWALLLSGVPADPTKERVTLETPRETTRARFLAMDTALRDSALTFGARFLYYHLDWHARLEGRCWPKLPTLSAETGASVRQIERWVNELKERGHLRTVRHRTHIEFVLAWRDTTPVSDHGASEIRHRRLPDTTPVSDHHLIDKTRQGNTLAGLLAEAVGDMQAAYPRTQFSQDVITASFLERLVAAGEIETQEEAGAFCYFCASRFKGGRMPGRLEGPNGIGLLVRWAQDFAERRREKRA